jgi:hypothetical protein
MGWALRDVSRARNVPSAGSGTNGSISTAYLMPVRKARLPMRTVAFHFSRDQAAREALKAIHEQGFSGQVEIAPVSIEGEDGRILGLTVDDEALANIVEIARANEGRIVADVPEEWTLPRTVKH